MMNSDFIYFSSKSFQDEIGEIKPNMVKPFWSEGKWSMHDLLIYLLNISGKANVYLSTFSISEPSIRVLAMLMEKDMIAELHCIFDNNVKKHKLNLLFFTDQITKNIRLLPNHSKIILIENDSWTISVVGSANLTPNPRKEAGVILSDKHSFEQYKFHMINAMNNGLPAEF